MNTTAPSPQAFVALLLLACLFGGNHVAARVAFDHGTDVVTAVAARSLVTAVVVAGLVWLHRVPLVLTPRQRRIMPLIGLLVAVQSVCLYGAVARIPVGLALLAFNSWPLWTGFWAYVLYREAPQRQVLLAMPVILVGLALALDVWGAASGLGARGQWSVIGPGVALAVAAGASFGVVLALTQHEVAALDGRLRSAITMAIVGVLALAAAPLHGGLHWPNAPAGWWGLAALTILYGTAFTSLFVLLPRLGVVGSSPILNVEPVAALVMAWALLGQAIAPVQWLGALLVVGAVMALGLRRRR
ncbi:MAG: DMT family transporter [Burkholderiaceae bacterium]|nr:DMT family transporter [Burkholderiaceae bacterium]